KRIFQPTCRPGSEPSSSAIRRATDVAAIRRGWVWPIRPRRPCPASAQILGSWVVLPEPVSPLTITTGERCNASMISSRAALTGSSAGSSNSGSASGTYGARTSAIRCGPPPVAGRRPDRRFFGGRAVASGCVGMARNYNRCMNDELPPALHAPGPDPMPRSETASGPSHQPSFVAWLRTVAPYIHAFRGRTFVIGIAGELIDEGRLTALVNDISLLNAMGMRIVLVHGSRPQVVE